MKKKVIALILTAVMALSVFALSSCDESTLGLGAFVNTESDITAMYKSMFEGYGAIYTENSDKNAAAAVELTFKSTSDEQFNSLLPVALKGNAVYNVDEKKVALTTKAQFLGQEIGAGFYVYDGAVYIDLGTGKYIKFDIPEDAEEANGKTVNSAKTVKEGLEALKALLIEKIEVSDFISEKIKIDINGKSEDAAKITLELDKERLAEIGEAYKATCEKNKEQLLKVYEFLKNINAEEGETPETVEEIEAWLTALIEKIKTGDVELVWDYIIQNGKLIKEKVSAGDKSGKFVCETSFDGTETGAEGKIKLAVVDEEGNEKVIILVTYTLLQGEGSDTHTVVFEIPGTEKSFKTEMVLVTHEDYNDLSIKWIVADETVVELTGKLKLVQSDTLFVFDFDGKIIAAEKEFAFQITVKRDNTGDAELVIPEFTEENVIDYESYTDKFKPTEDDGENKEEWEKLGNGKIDLEFPPVKVEEPVEG